MQIIIFEGVASSGKTTLEKLLAVKLPHAEIISENETLMGLIENRNVSVAQKHLRKMISDIASTKTSTVIIDRFHFTHAFRTGVGLDEFAEIEHDLKELGEILLILLTIDEDHIRERIEETIERRKDKWKKGAQGSIEEKTTYYTDQQKQLLRFADETALPKLIINTTEKNWKRYTEEIISEIK